MKKKIVLVAAVLALVLICLTACNNIEGTLSNITKLLQEDYSVITLNVTTKTAEVTLNGTYTFTFGSGVTTVNYRYDVLNELDINGNNADEYKQTIRGTATVYDDGTMMENGSVVNLPLSEIDFTGLSFKAGFFANAKVSVDTFEADVKNPKGFIGNSDFICSKMHVRVSFDGDSLSVLKITYVSANNNEVAVSYMFVK